MRLRYLSIRILLLSATCLPFASPASAQVQSAPNQTEDVVRVNTALVQTDVMVFDKGGTFVQDLKREQFVLKINGKERQISFFEQVRAGSRNEEAQLAAARGNAVTASGTPVPLDRGRTIFFFVDDLHLSASSMHQARTLLSRFIDREMSQNDEAAITSTSGQIGFLQQLTDNKAVLRAATDRLKPRPYSVRDTESPPMSEYQALLIDRRDEDVLNVFVDEVLKQSPGTPRAIAEEQVRARSSAMLHEAASVTANTLATLESLVKNSASLSGRKLIFFLSDGFFLDARNSDSYDRVQKITSAAAASGVIIYSIDTRGLTTGMPDASIQSVIDTSGRLTRANGGELMASQDGLNALANDTGGRAFFNSNALSAAVTSALKETSIYYLLAWRPETEEQRNPRFRRVEVSVIGRPELLVRSRRGFGEVEPATRTKNTPETAKTKTPGEELRASLRAPYPQSSLPVSVTANFVDTAQRGSVLVVALKIATNQLVFESVAGAPTAYVDLAGIVFDDQGKMMSSFDKHLTLKANTANANGPPPESLFYNHFSVIKPGLYEVRVAAFEEKQRRAGSALQWIEIPDLTTKSLALSSLIVGERKADSDTQPELDVSKQDPNAASQQVGVNVDHRFARTSHLRFMTFVYNALANGASGIIAPGADLAVQVQVFRDNEPVITDPLHKITADGATDPGRVPYAAELQLSGLQPGQYVLQVTVIDRLAKASASQRYSFQVD